MIELNDRCGYGFTVDKVPEREVFALTTKSHFHLKGELVNIFPQPGVVSHFGVRTIVKARLECRQDATNFFDPCDKLVQTPHLSVNVAGKS